MSEANKQQVGGAHYKERPHQIWDLVVQMQWDFFQGNIVKYVDRFRRKNGVEDLKKARHYLDKLIEIEDQKISSVKAEVFYVDKPEPWPDSTNELVREVFDTEIMEVRPHSSAFKPYPDGPVRKDNGKI